MDHFRRLAAKALAGALAGSMLMVPALAATGTVDAVGGLRLRNSDDTSGAVLATLPNGSQVEVTGVTGEGWYQVTYQGVSGYACDDYLVVDETEAQGLETVSVPLYGRVTAGPLNVRSEPSTDAGRSKQLAEGTIVDILEELEGWYRIEDGYISADYVEIIDPADAVPPAAASSSSGSAVVDYAMQYKGYPYVYGGSSPRGFDCSGFVKYVFSHFGVSLPHSASSQMRSGTSISSGQLQPGDIVFFAQTSSGRASHSGIYIGNGEFIHASSPSTGVIISRLDSHTGRGYCGARRVV